jgi:hypothetical protein|tara:strand:- start:302 stop:427 length:126 start_codon:yes stop_codon:yes gene_type:complete
MKALAFKVRDGIDKCDVEAIGEVVILTCMAAITFLAMAPLV